MESGELDTPPSTLERRYEDPPVITHGRVNADSRAPTSYGDGESRWMGVGAGANVEDLNVSGRASQDGRRATSPHHQNDSTANALK